MPAKVIAPTATHLIEIDATRTDGPPRWTMDSPQRCDRVRCAVLNSGIALPTGEIRVRTDGHSEALDLPAALAVLLADPAHRHLRRRGWIAWGALRLDGSIAPADEPLVNDLPARPCVGRVWAPEYGIPKADDDAVISLVDVTDLRQAWDVVVFLTSVEEVILGDSEPDPPACSTE